MINLKKIKLKQSEYTDNPVLDNSDELYYSGAGCTWGTDKNGQKYWKRYSPAAIDSHFTDKYDHLSIGDIVNEKARIEKIMREIIEENSCEHEEKDCSISLPHMNNKNVSTIMDVCSDCQSIIPYNSARKTRYYPRKDGDEHDNDF
jgi:hypothetical protein